MIKDKNFLEVNDYLDLFLLARSLDDKSWQQEIIEKLKDFPKENIQKKEVKLTIDKLNEEFRMVNMNILDVYRELRKDPGNIHLRNKLARLEQTSKYLSKKIRMEENRLEHHRS